MKIVKEIGREPHIDWIVILVVSIIIALGLAFTGFYLYNAVESGNIKGDETKRPASFTKLNEEAIATVLDRFEKREEVSEKARKGYTGPTDPSL